MKSKWSPKTLHLMDTDIGFMIVFVVAGLLSYWYIAVPAFILSLAVRHFGKRSQKEDEARNDGKDA